MKNRSLINLYFKEKVKIAKKININEINKIYEKLLITYKKSGNLYLMANGGPAGLIDNASTDLRFHPFVSDDKSVVLEGVKKLKVISLIESAGALTGISNDVGFENVFVEQLKKLCL